MKESLTTHIPTLENLAHFLTKVLSGRKSRDLVEGALWDFCNYVRLSVSNSDGLE